MHLDLAIKIKNWKCKSIEIPNFQYLQNINKVSWLILIHLISHISWHCTKHLFQNQPPEKERFLTNIKNADFTWLWHDKVVCWKNLFFSISLKCILGILNDLRFLRWKHLLHFTQFTQTSVSSTAAALYSQMCSALPDFHIRNSKVLVAKLKWRNTLSLDALLPTDRKEILADMSTISKLSGNNFLYQLNMLIYLRSTKVIYPSTA